jgi:predicted nucleotidyltransferase
MERERDSLKVRKIIRNCIESILAKYGVEVKEIILFGSRAKGNYKKDSDWDCFVIVDRELSREKKREIVAKIRMFLARLSIPTDIIIRSTESIENQKNDVGYLTYYVLREGVRL